MRTLFVALSITMLAGMGIDAEAQTRAGAASIKQCSLLTRELVQKVSAANKQPFDASGPKELPLGASGVACEWGDVILQIDPFPPARLEALVKTGGKGWESVPGVGDAAYFHNVQDQLGELFVRVGPRTFAVMLTIPAGSTAAATKPQFITLAQAIVPKLR